MKIALLGYGKMGKSIAEIAQKRGHKITVKIDSPHTGTLLENVDVAIDFSTPSAAFDNIARCLKNRIPVVSGTTGWLSKYDEAVGLCQQYEGAFMYASNFSLGVNLFFELNEWLAKRMDRFQQYEVAIEETHHTQKLDAPSGTAISLARGIQKHSGKTQWYLVDDHTSERDGTIPITAKRIAGIPGTHRVTYASSIDTIEIKHTAHSRQGFALGAVIAAEWIQNKKGIFTMKDMLDI